MFKFTVVVFVTAMIVLSISGSSEGARKPPFNGSIFGKRFIRDMDTDSRVNEIRHPACEYVLEACNQWYMSGQESQ